jgi:hypothetical protein
VEVGQAVLALDLIDAELDVAERLLLVLVEVGERQLKDPALQGVVGGLCETEGGEGALGQTEPSSSARRRRREVVDDALRPAERLTRVLPTLRTSNIEGALMSYHSAGETRGQGRAGRSAKPGGPRRAEQTA